MREVSLYVNNVKLDLFNDEQIQVTSTIQNLQDISKVFTDFTQTFTVPCSKINNGVFQHYYNNDVDSTFSAQNRQEARIEINNTFFRKGKVQLESAEIKGLESDNYKITFYGEVTTLKDLFSTDKLSDLDYDLDIDYDDATIINAQNDISDLDVRFPLISSNRVWQYGDASPADISTNSGKINFYELFPAVRDKVILDSIEQRYGITFSGLFLTDERFERSFTWWKNMKHPNFTLKPRYIDFAVGGSPPLADGILTLKWIDPSTYAPSGYISADTVKFARFQLTPDFTGTFFVQIEYRNIYTTGNITQWFPQGSAITVNGVAGSSSMVVVLGGSYFSTGSQNYDREYRYVISSYTSGTITGKLLMNVSGTWVTSGGANGAAQISSTLIDIEPVVISNAIDFKYSAPDITVEEYFKGLLNQFNLTCFPTSTNLDFQLEPLDRWYKYGKDFNVSEFIDVDSIQVERIKLYKSISFEYQDSKSFMNVAFSDSFNREYGNLSEEFDYDGGDFRIKLPFENLLFNKFDNTELQVAYSMTDAIENAEKTYIPKCTKLYLEKTTTPADFYLGSGHLTSYLPFGQDTSYAGQNYSLNFGLEQSTLKDDIVENSLFYTYYNPYLSSLFNPKARRTKCKAKFPLSFLTDITLNSKLIIRDKKYIIEEMKTNLTTGEVDLVLLNDYIVGAGRRKFVEPLPSTGVTIKEPIVIVRGNHGFPFSYAEIGLPIESLFVTTTPSLPTTVTESVNFEFIVPANSTGLERTNSIPITYFSLDGTEQFTEYLVITQEEEKIYLTGGGAKLFNNRIDFLIE